MPRNKDKGERIVENLAVASALGFLALVVAAVSLAADMRASTQERNALAPRGSTLAVAGRLDAPGLDRVYRMKSDGSSTYATVLAVRASSGSCSVGAFFSPKGELQELRFIGSCDSSFGPEVQELVASVPDAVIALEKTAEFVRRLEAGGSEKRS